LTKFLLLSLDGLSTGRKCRFLVNTCARYYLDFSRFHVEEAGADAKLNQHGPLGVAYHRRHPISTVPVARITAHATVPGYNLII
jgi:hypothetical protein